MRLSTFIQSNKEPILQKWEDFARTIEPPALTMDVKALRDHASLILDIVIADLDTAQTPDQQSEKSMGRGPRGAEETYAEIHATGRLESGYTIIQLLSEYRALRTSVLTLWTVNAKTNLVTDLEDVTRFNEAIDQAVAESVARFAEMTATLAEYERLRLNAVLNAAPVGITLADGSGKLILANPENSRIWGDVPVAEKMVDYEGWKGWWADGSEKHGQPVKPNEWPQVRALAGDASPRDIIEIEPFGSPGVRRTILFHGTPVKDAIAKVVGSVVAQMDITDLLRTEAALRESEAKFRTIANAMPQMVWSALPDGFHDYFNQQWYDFTGVPVGTTEGEGWNAVFHADDQLRAKEVWRRSLTTGDTYDIQYRLRHHSGEYRWTLGRALPIRDDTGEIVRWMGTCTDIHEQKNAEGKLKQADERKDEFLAMLAHELRNPLAPISAAAELLNMMKMDETKIKQTSAIITRQVVHMTGLVDDLLDVSRITRGLIELEKSRLDIRRIVADAVEQVSPMIHARRHNLMLHVLPTTGMVLGDTKRLVQVIANVLANAAKYTHEGGNILLRTEVHEERIIVTIEDDGIGMEPELVERVFDLFSQAKRTSDRSAGGLGLGLSLVKSLVQLHNGSVSCTSAGIGKGSRFVVCFPRLTDVLEKTDRGRNSPHPPEAFKSLKIMVVDDNIDAAQMLAMYLEANGHAILVEHNSRRALERARIELPDVCLLDIGLPDFDGNELAKKLRAQPGTAKTVLIAVTGYGQEHDRQHSLASGFDYHMVKPVDTAKLFQLLATLSLT